MRFRDKIGRLHHPIPKPANLPDFLAVVSTYVPGGVVARFKRDIELLFRTLRRMTCCDTQHFIPTSYLEPFTAFQRCLCPSCFGRFLDHAWREQTCRLILRITVENHTSFQYVSMLSIMLLLELLKGDET